MGKFKGELRITREAMFNNGWIKHSFGSMQAANWDSDSKTIEVEFSKETKILIEWDELAEKIPIDLPSTSRIAAVGVNSVNEIIFIGFESDQEEKYIKAQQPNGEIYLIGILGETGFVKNN